MTSSRFMLVGRLLLGLRGLDLRYRDEWDAQLRNAPARLIERSVHVDGPTSILNDDGGKPDTACILGGIANAEIQCEASKERTLKATLAQVAGQSGRGSAIVFEEHRIRINVLVIALSY